MSSCHNSHLPAAAWPCLGGGRSKAEETWSQIFKGTEMFLAEMGKEHKTGSVQARELCTTPRSQLCSLDLPRRTSKFMPCSSSDRDHDLALDPQSSPVQGGSALSRQPVPFRWTPAVVPADCNLIMPVWYPLLKDISTKSTDLHHS